MGWRLVPGPLNREHAVGEAERDSFDELRLELVTKSRLDLLPRYG